MARKLLVSVVGNNEKERQFWVFFSRDKDRSPATMLGSSCQSLDLRERRWSHGGAGVLWWCREKLREKEMNFFFIFAKRGKARGGESLKIFLAAMVGNGCGALELRERENMVVR